MLLIQKNRHLGFTNQAQCNSVSEIINADIAVRSSAPVKKIYAASRVKFFNFATLLFALLSLTTGMSLCHAQVTYQSLDSIRNTIKNFIKQNASGETSTNIGKLDSRLRLGKCAEPLKAQPPAKSSLLGKLSIAVSCTSPKPWKIYVPVTISRTEMVMSSAHPLTRNHVLEAGDVTPKLTKITSSRQQFYTTADTLVGMRVRYPISAGEILTPKKLKSPLLIKRGEKVTILANTPNLQVRMQGKALTDGSRGQTIRVRNLSSNRVVEGVVARRGVVQIPM